MYLDYGNKEFRKLIGNHQLGRPRIRWEDNIMMDLRHICCMAGAVCGSNYDDEI
jgi:hypothetical protein